MAGKETGGPAFPENIYRKIGNYEIGTCNPGMSLRDYYKGQAIVGILSGLTENKTFGLNNKDNNDGLAIVAGCIADAMIKEKNNE